jgi:tRNA/rRNA methyltransferase
MDVRIVLVEPQDAGNIGAAARAMKNFGYRDLVVVESTPARVDSISEWWASGAEEMVHSAPRVATLEEALADCHLTVATTAARKRDTYDQLTPRTLARFASESLAEGERLAIVFGRERSGLTTEEVALCQRTATIETSPEFPTMNLAVSVAVFCHELAGSLRPAPESKDPATDDLLQMMHRRAFDLLREVSFLYPDNPERVYREFRALAGRAHLTHREVSLLLAAISKIEWRLGMKAKGGERKVKVERDDEET